jgi:heterodisulfide reductase subunit B
LEALGAEVVRYPLKTKCCGGSLTGTVPVAGLRLVYILLKEALKRGADVIATVCPLCQFNLDAYHPQVTAAYERVDIPTVYFTQLMGLAFGLDERELGLHRSVVRFRLAAAAPDQVAGAHLETAPICGRLDNRGAAVPGRSNARPNEGNP